MGHHQLDTLDEQILKLIADNARIPFLEVARACNVSGAAIHQRIHQFDPFKHAPISVSSGSAPAIAHTPPGKAGCSLT